jgi:iron-sulfur cluster assembly accessory protein
MKEVIAQQPEATSIRISVQGGGCGGFQYKMALEEQTQMLDKTYNFDGIKVLVDQASLLYLNDATVDYVETLEASGFKFDNPGTKSTCGCGSSFNM